MSLSCGFMNGVPVGINDCVGRAYFYISQLSEVLQQHVRDRREGILNGWMQREYAVTLTDRQS